MFDPDDDPTQNNVAWFLMGDFFRLSPCAQDVEKRCFGDYIFLLLSSFLRVRKTVLPHFVFFP